MTTLESDLINQIETVVEEEIFLKSWPAIGYICKNKELMTISLCPVRNIDERIKTLEEQIKNGELTI